MKFSSEQPEELSSARCEDELRKINGTLNSPGPSRGNHDNLFLGSTATTFLQQFPTAGVHLEEDQADARSGQPKEGVDPPETREILIPPDRFANQVRSDTLRRMYVPRGLGKKYGPTLGCLGCATIGSHHQASHSDTCRDRMRAELEKSEEGREYLAREEARVDARKQEQSSSSGHKRAVSEEWDRPPEKFWRMGEEDVTMSQDVTATGGASSSSASRGPAMDIESRPSR